MKIRSLFQKTICSLATIIDICNDKEITDEATLYLKDLTKQYYEYVNYKNIFKLAFKYRQTVDKLQFLKTGVRLLTK